MKNLLRLISLNVLSDFNNNERSLNLNNSQIKRFIKIIIHIDNHKMYKVPIKICCTNGKMCFFEFCKLKNNHCCLVGKCRPILKLGKMEKSVRTCSTCWSAGLTSSPTFNLANDKRTSSNFVFACSKSKSLSNLMVVFGRPLLAWLLIFWRNDCCNRIQMDNSISRLSNLSRITNEL